MYHIHGFGLSFNTMKVLYVAEELGVDYQFTSLDFAAGENKAPEHLARHPLGKTPTLDHDGKYLFESSAISRYMANVAGSPLYPHDEYPRAIVDQWVDYFSIHPGRWLATLLFERVFRSQFGMGDKNEAAEEEALGFLETQLGVVNDQLAKHDYLTGNEVSIADSVAFAYLETTAASDFSLEPFPNIAAWLSAYASRPAVGRAKERAGG